MTEKMNTRYDAVVIGGGAAGLSGALMLSRARRSTLVIDAGKPRNAPAAGVHGLLGHDGIAPGQLLDRGRAEVRGYGGHVVSASVEAVHRDDEGFAVTLSDDRSVRARRLLLASGLVDEIPDIPGLRERWGRDVVHCPYCHGWEVRDQAIGVLATGSMSVHGALLFRQWTKDVTLFTHDRPEPSAEEAEQLAARGIRVVAGRVTSVEVAGDRLTGLRLEDGTVVGLQAVAAASRMVARADFLSGIGLQTVEHPSGMGSHLPTDTFGRTEITGVWAAGNLTDLSAQVGASAAQGAMAGAQINADLLAEETRAAVTAYRSPFSPESEARVCEQVLGNARHGV